MFDLPTCLSKFLCIGYSLGQVVDLATAAAARILGLEGRGSLKPGSLADIGLFRILNGEFPLYDIDNQVRVGKQLLVNVHTIVNGRPMRRRPPPQRPHWVEEWANAGAATGIIAFQRDLRRRGHDPSSLARACGCCPDDNDS